MPPAPFFLTGFEHGVAILGATPTPDARIWTSITSTGGAPTIESTGAIKSGSRVLRCPGTAAASYVQRTISAGTPTIGVASFDIFFDGALPNADCRLFTMVPLAGSFAFLQYVSAGTTLRAGFGGTTALPGQVVVADRWYHIDYIVDYSVSPRRVEVFVDGVSIGFTTTVVAASSLNTVRIGSNVDSTTATAPVRYDNLILSSVYSDFPLGAHEILPLRPNRDGTHSFTAGDFIHGDAGSNVGVSDTDVYTFLDDTTIETIDTTDSIRQSVVRTDGYVEFGIEGPPFNGLDRIATGIQVSGSYDSTSASANACTLKENDGGTLRDVYTDADVSQTSVVFLSHCLTTAPAGARYTRAVIEALKFRWGFSGTVPPILHGLMVEAAFPIFSSSAGFGGGGFVTWAEVPWGAIEDPVAGGTTFEHAVDGATSPTGAIIKQPNKALAGATSPAAVLIREAGKLLGGAISPAGSLLRDVAMIVEGALSPSGAVLEQINRLLAGSLSPTGALEAIKAVLVSFAGATSPAGSLIRDVSMLVEGTTSPSGALTKAPRFQVEGSVSPTGALAAIKAVLISLAGTITSSSVIIWQANKKLIGFTTPGGFVAKRPLTSRAGSLSPTGASALTHLSFASFAGSIASSGVLSKTAAMFVEGAIAPAGVILRTIGRLFAGVLDLAGVFVRPIQPARDVHDVSRVANDDESRTRRERDEGGSGTAGPDVRRHHIW